MRALFSTPPGSGHFLPLVPLARGLQERGHDVLVATSPAFAPDVAKAGFAFQAVGRPWLVGRFEEVIPELRTATGEARALMAHRLGFAGPLGLEAAVDVAALLRRERFDLVVFDGAAYGSGLAAAGAGLPRAAVGSGILALDRRWIGALEAELAIMQEAVGLAPAPTAELLFRDLVLSAVPAGFYGDADLAPTFAAFRLDDYEAGSAGLLPDWPGLRTDRPLVYVTLGSVQNKRVDVFRAVLEGLAGEPVNVVLTTGVDVDPAVLGRPPENARIERFIPQAALLPRCDLVVHHAGSGTLRGATWHGLPQLLLPITADQPRNAVIAEGLGFALVLKDDGSATPDAVAGAVRRLLSEPAYRTAAQRVSAEMRSLPPLAAALDRLEALAAAEPATA